jgi:hypothetical protein
VRNIDVAGAAGHESSQGADYPAAYAPVLSVAATGMSVQYCSFLNRGPDVDITAPGCDLDSADPVAGSPRRFTNEGTSEAAAWTSTALVALRGYRPELTDDQAESLIVRSAHGAPVHRPRRVRVEGELASLPRAPRTP